MIRGIGIDVIEVPRVERAVARWGEAFLGRVFTDAERRHAGTAPGAHPSSLAGAGESTDGRRVLGTPGAAQRLAGRFAAKEAVMKALGLGWRSMAWREIEIATDPLGKPVVHLSGRAAAAARRLGVGAWLVSISHTRRLAIAQALAE